MRKILGLCLFVCSGMAPNAAWCQSQATTSKGENSSHEPKVAIEGLVRDIACPIQNLEATATHLSMKCLRACARRGSPLVILSEGGDLYLPISDKMPDTDQRQKLIPFLGKYVRVSGTIYERNGTRAIAISKIKELKGVPLAIEDR
jgi:hypothetical protein